MLVLYRHRVWKTKIERNWKCILLTVDHKMLLKCFRSHSQCGCWLMISGQVHSLSCPLVSSVNLQNLPPNRYLKVQCKYSLLTCACVFFIRFDYKIRKIWIYLHAKYAVMYIQSIMYQLIWFFFRYIIIIEMWLLHWVEKELIICYI